jgi:hypothetical protein
MKFRADISILVLLERMSKSSLEEASCGLQKPIPQVIVAASVGLGKPTSRIRERQ